MKKKNRIPTASALKPVDDCQPALAEFKHAAPHDVY
jgi:hypothetical protein